MNEIYAVIVTYNPDIDLLNNQYEGLLKQVDGIIYVDNNSKEEIKSLFRQDDIKVHYILNECNEGLGYAQNQGIKKALGLGAEWILILDQDSELSENMVSDLKKCYDECSAKGISIGAVAPGVINVFDKSSPVLGIIINGFHSRTPKIGSEPMEVSYCIASGTLTKKEVIEDVGLINEDMFIDFLDLEWCMRARFKGYHIYMSPIAKLYHRLGNGKKNKIESHSPIREYYICRNGIRLLRFSYVPLGFRCRCLILTPIRVIRALLSGQKEYVAMGIKGIYHAIIGKGGKY